jgi:proline iminopeptidase
VAGRYPEIEPYEHGMLDVGDGNLVYWEACGDPVGKPALVVHGGPGSGCGPGMRRYFDPARYRIVLFDQRGCGRSTPHASDPATDLSTNTTKHLLADMERLREHLAIDRWLLFGGSWGSVLSLAYAERYPDRVSEIVLTAIATDRRVETDLLTRGLGVVFPEPWARFRDAVPEAERDGDLAAAYARLLADPDAPVREKAAADWCDWEDAMKPGPPSLRYEDPAFRMAFARLVTHYFSNGAWLEDGEIIRRAGTLAGIPGILVQGSLDLGNLVGTPWLLAQAWPGSELVTIDMGGHGSGPGMSDAIVAATDRFAKGALAIRGSHLAGRRPRSA